jgi:TolB-like protein/Tfp pilus assembly protein PilF
VAVTLGAFVLVAAMFGGNVGGLRDRVFGPAPGEVTAIAVLPLRNISGDPEQDYLAVGVTEMLITELGRVGGLRVPSHQTVMQYADTKKPLAAIAGELNVEALIEGTVLRAGDRLRITINFVQAKPERHLLSEKYDHELGDLLLVQDNVTRDVAGRIRAGLPPDLQRGVGKPRSVNPEVDDAYLRGRYLMSRGTDADRAKAHEFFQQAVQKDPNFAPGYAAIALLDAHGGAYRAAGAGPEFRGKARQMALKALELDPTMAEAHVALGWLELNDWDFAGADREFKRAIELNPNLVVARMWYAPYLGAVQRIEEADAQCEIALRLEPASPVVLTHVAWPNLYGGRPDRVIEVARKALELEPNYYAAYNLLGRAYFVKGMYAESVAALEKAIELGGGGIGSGSVLAAAYIKAGRRAEGLKLIREYEQRPRGPNGGRGLGYAYIATGEIDKAIVEVEGMVERRGPYAAFLIADPLFAPLRSEPRFLDLIRRVGFPPDTLRRAGIPDAPPASQATLPRPAQRQP